MEAQIIEQPAFDIIGIELRTTTLDGNNFTEIPRFWQDVLAQDSIARIPDRKDANAVLGISIDMAADGSFSYIIGCEVTTTENKPAGMVARTVSAATYAVFTARGNMPDAIQQTTRSIYREWLPNSGYRRTDGADIERYDERFEDSDNPEMDIYVPIVSSS